MKRATVAGVSLILVVAALWLGPRATQAPAGSAITISTRMEPPRWAILERQLLAENVPAAREFFAKYFDARGYLQCFVRWGANDGPDDAFEQFNRWPELHALGASDEVRQLFERGHEGLLRQYTEARTSEVPIGRGGMYYKEYVAQSDWMHHGEGLQLFNRMGLSAPADATYQERARRFAGFYMGEDPEAPNYDAQFKIIRSMQNGSRGPMLRKATSIDWVGDPFDVKLFDAEHGESTFDQFLAHYEEYTDVVGDHFLNVAATTLPTNAFLLTGDEKYKRWVVADRDARGCDAGVQRASVGERHTRRNHQCGGCAGADRPPWARCGRTSASHHAALRECADGATSWQRQPPAATARSGTRPGPPVPLP